MRGAAYDPLKRVVDVVVGGLVLLLSPDPIPYAKVRSLLWQQSDAPVAEGQTAGAAARVRPIDGEPEAIAAD